MSDRAAGPSQTEPEHQPIREVVVMTDYTRGLGRRIPNTNHEDADIVNFKYVYDPGNDSFVSCAQERPTVKESGQVSVFISQQSEKKLGTNLCEYCETDGGRS